MSKSEDFCVAPPLVPEILRCEWKIDCFTLSELYSEIFNISKAQLMKSKLFGNGFAVNAEQPMHRQCVGVPLWDLTVNEHVCTGEVARVRGE